MLQIQIVGLFLCYKAQIAALWLLNTAQEQVQNHDGRDARGAKRQQTWKSSAWALFLAEKSVELKNPGSKVSKSFRNRFRMPYPIFERLSYGQRLGMNQMEAMRELSVLMQ